MFGFVSLSLEDPFSVVNSDDFSDIGTQSVKGKEQAVYAATKLRESTNIKRGAKLAAQYKLLQG